MVHYEETMRKEEMIKRKEQAEKSMLSYFQEHGYDIRRNIKAETSDFTIHDIEEQTRFIT